MAVDKRSDEPRVHVALVSEEGVPDAGDTGFLGTSPDMPPTVGPDVVLAFLGGEGDAVPATRSTRANGR